MSQARLKRPQRRSSILDAATHVFAEDGYHAASMRAVAASAGVAKPLLYDHFGSKQGLYVAVIESIRDELTSATEAVMEHPTPVEVRLRSAIDGFFQYVESRPEAAKVLFTAPEGDAEAFEAWQQVQAGATARLVALVGAERGLLADARGGDRRLEVWTEFLKKGLHGLASWWTLHPEVPRRALVESVMEMVWGGLASQFVSQ